MTALGGILISGGPTGFFGTTTMQFSDVGCGLPTSITVEIIGSGLNISASLEAFNVSGNSLGIVTHTYTGPTGQLSPFTFSALASERIARAIYNAGLNPSAAASIGTLIIRTSINTLSVSKTGTGDGTVISTPPGISCGTTCSAAFNPSTVVTLASTPNANSVFAGWSGDSDCSDGQVTMDADKTCTATFNLQQFTLTVNKAGTGSGTVTSSPTGINCGSDCSEAYDINTVATLTATPDANSTFAGWSGDADCSDGQVTMNADKTCTATFNLANRTLTVAGAGTGNGTVTGTGINCTITAGSTSGDCSETVTHGTNITLTATDGVNSTFANWTNCDSVSGNQCTVTITEAKNVTATFSLNQFTLTVTKTGTGTGMVTSSPVGIDCGSDCSEVYPFNTVVTLTATPNAGSDFSGWTNCDSPSVNQCTMTMDADKPVMATFNLAYTLGDVNDDGKINAIDARLAQQHADGVITLTGTQFLAADVDQDSDVDSDDATAIAKKGIGLPTGIPGLAVGANLRVRPGQTQGSAPTGVSWLFLTFTLPVLALLRRHKRIATFLLVSGLSLGLLTGCVGFLGLPPPGGPAIFITSTSMPNGATRLLYINIQQITTGGGLASWQGRITYPAGAINVQSIEGVNGFVVQASCGTVGNLCPGSPGGELCFSLVKPTTGGVSNGAVLALAVQASGSSGQVYTLSWAGSAQAPIVLGGDTNIEITGFTTGNGQVKIQ